MNQLVLDRIVIRHGKRSIGPISGVFGPGVHGLISSSLGDAALIEDALGRGSQTFEGRMRAVQNDGTKQIVFLGDIVPLPPGHKVASFARVILGEGGDAALRSAKLPKDARTDHLSSAAAFAFAVGLVRGLGEAGALVVPPPETLVSRADERVAAGLLRACAASGLPVFILLTPGTKVERWVEDVIVVNEDGAASVSAGVASLRAPALAVTVRGGHLEQVAARMLRSGIEIKLSQDARELVVRSRDGRAIDGLLTEAIAQHSGEIDEVVAC